jgi:hypothetical protein
MFDLHPPTIQTRITKLNNLINQLPSPYIIMGDFNGHNPLWGSDKLTDKSKKKKKTRGFCKSK